MNDLCQLFDFHGRFSSIRSFYWPCTRFVRRKQKICLVLINTPPKELMNGHVILTRHGLRSSEWRGCWSREGALRAPSLYIESVQWIHGTAEVFFIVPGRPDQRHLLVEPWLPPENLSERQLWKVLRPRHVGRESDDDQTGRLDGSRGGVMKHRALFPYG